MGNTMSRRNAQRRVDQIYSGMNDIYNLLKPREHELDAQRAFILQKLERILITVSRDREYKEGIARLDDDGYREYVDMLEDLLMKMRYGRTNIRRPSISELRDVGLRYAMATPAFRAGIVRHQEPEPIRDIPESSWEKYVKRTSSTGVTIGPVPIENSFVLGSNYLVRFGNVFPTQNEATIESIDQRKNRPIGSEVADIVDFLNNGLKKYNGEALDGSHVGDTVFAYRKYGVSAPIDTWVVRFTYMDLLYNELRFSNFREEEARMYLQKIKSSRYRNEREAYEKVLSLFI